jgi:hypothetical protein
MENAVLKIIRRSLDFLTIQFPLHNRRISPILFHEWIGPVDPGHMWGQSAQNIIITIPKSVYFLEKNSNFILYRPNKEICLFLRNFPLNLNLCASQVKLLNNIRMFEFINLEDSLTFFCFLGINLHFHVKDSG